MKPLFIMPILLLGLAAIANAADTTQSINEVTWENAKFNVAQIVNNQAIEGLGTAAQLTTVYNGSIAAPFEIFLSVWDPLPQDGSDLGTGKTFSLGHFAGLPKILDQKLVQDTMGEDTIQVKLRMIRPDNVRGPKIINYLVSITVEEGTVKSPILLKQIK